MSLFSLLKNTSGVQPLVHPTCLFLDWPGEAKWLNAHEIDRSSIKWSCTVQWKELGCDILIATNYATGTGIGSDPTLTDGFEAYHNIPYLKSHLQKCVRRSNSYKALKTATHFYHLDANEFLRRLCIIAIEDALPLTGFSTLVWMTAAVSHAYVLSKEHFCWLLGYIHDLCQCTYYEQFPASETADLKSMRLRSLNEEGRNLCYSIMFRQAYGGMKHDKQLLSSVASVWATRFRLNAEFIKLLQRKTIYISPPYDALDRSEWITAAVDFHCYPGILLNLSEKHDQYTPEDIKEAIWHCSSSLTNKANLATDLKQRDKDSPRQVAVWQTIKRDFNSLSKFMVIKNA